MATQNAFNGGTVAKVGAGFAIALVLLYLFGTVVGWAAIARTLRAADPRWFGLALASTTLGLAAWAKAWDEVLCVIDVDIPFPSLVVTYFAGTFADYVTPMGKAGGGPLIAYLLSTDDRISYHESLATLTTADLLNLVPYFLFAVVGGLGLAFRGGLPRRADLLAGALGGVAVVVGSGGYLAWRYRTTVTYSLVALLTPVLERTPFVDVATVREEIHGFYEEMDRIADEPRLLGYTLALGVTGWVLFTIPLYLAGLTVGVTLDPLVVMFVVTASTVAGLVPTPGGLGGVEVALVGLLVALTPLSAGSAAAIALLYRVASYWYVLGVGGLAAFYEVYSY
ncbi:lysylphosphatidylglycerol synthase transmembrane domain-containing protein [Halorientalis brevis]|uniref:Lysylphosphatidylglycerol synthase transmembrane domain-containing protein n=1 Tax=Halorientalis brevis TaxID=1126241 RepID=A0ABD6CBJ1_9EURY|nr:lysylphosphatidylglycerol synthase transmembrane domain-containing protein [Halorientalis brevis]